MKLQVEVVPVRVCIMYGDSAVHLNEAAMREVIDGREPPILKDWWWNEDVPIPPDGSAFWSELKLACRIAIGQIESQKIMRGNII